MSENLTYEYDPLDVNNYTAEQIRYMVDSPSAEALARLPLVSTDADIRYSSFEKRTPYRQFLHEQTLGYYDEIVVAMHASDQAFTTFMQRTVAENPNYCITKPELFEQFATPANRNELIQKAILDGNNCRYHFEEAAALLNDHRARRAYGDRALLTYGYSLDPASFVGELIDTEHYSHAEKKLAIEELITSGRTWNSIDVYHVLPVEKSVNSSTQETAQIFIERLNEVSSRGLVTPNNVEKALDALIQRGKQEGSDGAYDSYYAEIANKAKLALRAVGFLPSTVDKPLDDWVKEYIDRKLENLTSVFDIDTFEAAVFVKNNLINLESVRGKIKRLDGPANYAIDEITVYLERFNGAEKLYETDSSHSDDEIIMKFYQKYIIDGASMDTVRNYDFIHKVGHYNGDLHDETFALIEKYMQQGDLDLGRGRLATYKIHFPDEPERVKRVVLSSLQGGAESKNVPFDDIDSFMMYSGWDLANVRAHTANVLKCNWNVGNMMNDLTEILDSSTPVFTPAECAELAAARIHGYELDNYETTNLVDFCRKYLGRELTNQYIRPHLSDKALLLLPHERQNITMDEVQQFDYYDIYQKITKLDSIQSAMSHDAYRLFIDRALELSDEHLADKLIGLWWHLDETQQKYAFDRIMNNPLLTSIELGVDNLRNLYRLMGYDRQLETKNETPDPLQQIAPKSYQVMMRRLKAKTLSFASQAERVNATNVFPESLENSHRNVETTYTYHYDLVNRLAGFDGQLLMNSQIRGKATDRNELETLELMVLLREAAGIKDATAVEQLGRDELQELAFVSAVKEYGLNKGQASVVYDSLKQAKANTTKLAMWLHTSVPSKKVVTFIKPYLEYIAAGNTTESWKLYHPLAKNLPSQLTHQQATAWASESANQLAVQSLGTLTFRYTNDLETLVLAGARPIGNCLHYGSGINQRALAGLLNADAKILSIENAKGNPVANAIMRVALTTDDKPVVVIEPLYTSVSDPHVNAELHRATIHNAEAYAHSLDLELSVANVDHYDKQMQAALSLMWQTAGVTELNIFSQPSKAPYSYSDTAGVKSGRTHLRATSRKSTKLLAETAINAV